MRPIIRIKLYDHINTKEVENFAGNTKRYLLCNPTVVYGGEGVKLSKREN